jgi:hypothetical protein
LLHSKKSYENIIANGLSPEADAIAATIQDRMQNKITSMSDKIEQFTIQNRKKKTLLKNTDSFKSLMKDLDNDQEFMDKFNKQMKLLIP